MAADEFAFPRPQVQQVHQRYGPCPQALRGLRLGGGASLSPGWRSLVWSDIPNDRQLRWDESSGSVGVFRYPPATRTATPSIARGRLLSCEHGGRRVSRTEFDGTVTTIVDSYEGKRLNSPNDVVVKSDDSIWFTDPAYGIESDYEGHRSEASSTAAMSSVSTPHRRDAHRRRRFARPNGSPSRQTSACSTSRTPALRMDRTVPAISAASPSTVTASRRRGLRHVHGRVLRRLSARRRGPGLGQRRRRRPCL